MESRRQRRSHLARSRRARLRNRARGRAAHPLAVPGAPGWHAAAVSDPRAAPGVARYRPRRTARAGGGVVRRGGALAARPHRVRWRRAILGDPAGARCDGPAARHATPIGHAARHHPCALPGELGRPRASRRPRGDDARVCRLDLPPLDRHRPVGRASVRRAGGAVQRAVGHRQDARRRGDRAASSGSTCTASTWARWSASTSARPRRTSTWSSPRPRAGGRVAVRRGRRAVRQARRGPRRARPLRQPRGQPPARSAWSSTTDPAS